MRYFIYHIHFLFYNLLLLQKNDTPMDISELIKSYNAEQKNVFTGFCILTATSSILSIYFSFIWLCLCSSISKRRYKLEAFILILPILVTSSKLLISPSDYILGYEHALTTFLQASAILYTPFAIFGLILRKCIEYDKKQKGKNINNSV